MPGISWFHLFAISKQIGDFRNNVLPLHNYSDIELEKEVMTCFTCAERMSMLGLLPLAYMASSALHNAEVCKHRKSGRSSQRESPPKICCSCE
jgi:hypothetical protein